MSPYIRRFHRIRPGKNKKKWTNWYSRRTLVEITEEYSSILTDGTTDMQWVERDGYMCMDLTLTALGFDGVEDTDWECVEQIAVGWEPVVEGLAPALWVKEDSRSGLTLEDSIDPGVGDVSILPAYLKKEIGDEYAYVLDNGGLDVGNSSDLTLFCRYNPESTDKTAYRTIIGKDVSGFPNGCYYFVQNITNGNLYFAVRSSGTSIFVDTGLDLTVQAWPMLVLQIDVTNKVVKCYVDGVQRGGNQSYTGTFAALGNQYGFCIGSQNAVAGNGAMTGTRNSKGSYGDCGVIRRLLTPTEITNLNSNIIPSDCVSHWPNLGMASRVQDNTVSTVKIFDASGHNYDMTVNAIYGNKYKFGSYGSRHGLDVGYTLYENGFFEIYVPDTPTGERLNPSVPVGFTRTVHISGDSLNYNLSNAVLQMVHANWDRSDTTLWAATARTATTFYNSTSATTKKQIHCSELVNMQLNAWGNSGYERRNAVKMSDHSYGLRYSLKEIISFDSNLSDLEYRKLLYLADDYEESGIYENEFFYWKYDTNNIVATRGDKVLRYDYATHTLSLSLDNGVTYPHTLTIAGFGYIQFAYITASGVIAFADPTHFYRSTNNLSTYSSPTILDKDGNNYVALATDNWAQIGCSEYSFIGATEMIAWGRYSNTPTIKTSHISNWYSIDDFATVKEFYQYLAPNITCNHVHNFTQKSDNVFWCHIGDAESGTLAHFIEFTYDVDLDTWTAVDLYSGDSDSYYQASGIGFYDNNVLWGGDQGGSTIDKAIFKCAEADMANPLNYVTVFHAPDDLHIVFVLLSQDGHIIAVPWWQSTAVSGLAVVSCKDGGTVFNCRKTYGMPANLGVWKWRPKNNDGWYFGHLFKSTNTITDIYGSETIWIKFK